MASKSRRKRGKQSFHGKKKKGLVTPVLTTAEPAAASQAGTPAAPPTVTAPPAGRPSPAPTSTAAMYPYVPGDLKKIGISAAILIAVLAILSRVLP
jgi:hypothetical protein